jgi:hypothetical protein
MMEDEFVGTVVWSNRAESLRRHQAATCGVGLIDDVVHVHRPEPTWQVYNYEPKVEMEIDRRGLIDGTFRLDRLDDAVEWAERTAERTAKKGRPRVDGQVVSFDPAFVNRDDISCFVVQALFWSVNNGLSKVLPYLPVPSLLEWRRLSDLAVEPSVTFYGDMTLSADAGEIIKSLQSLRDAIAAAVMPSDLLNIREDTLRTHFAAPFERLAFEVGRARKPVTTVEEDEALRALAAN